MSSSPTSSSATEDSSKNGVSGDERRGLTPGAMEVTPAAEKSEETTLPESANGEPVAVSPREGSGSNKEQKQIYASQDLDKDIDSVLEYNVQNGQIDPNGSGNIQNITVDSTENSTLKIEVDIFPEEPIKSPESVDVDKVPIDAGSEKSFTSDTDNSAVAESVVKTALTKAVEIVRSEEVDKLKSVAKDQIAEAPKGDVKVGLFQYDFGEGGNSETDEETDGMSDGETEKESKHEDSQVGLFQYTDTNANDRAKGPEVSEVDDIIDDQLESTGEEKSIILKLYGLEGVEPISPKSASPSESGPSSLEERVDQKVLDVQREIYEPSTRHFSVTRDTSSNESTPRVDENGVQFDAENNDNLVANDAMEARVNDEDEASSQSTSNKATDSQKSESDTETEGKVVTIENVPKAEGNQPTSISPPLIQYESVKENGKFRIIKTTKEGGGTYSGIRVGGDVVSPKESPRSVESQKESPRENVADGNEKEHVDGANKSQTETRTEKQGYMNIEELQEHKENGSKVPSVQPESQGDTKVPAKTEREDDSADHVGLDRDRIRKLLEEENAPLKLYLSKDSSVSRDSGLPRSHYSERSFETNKPVPQHQNIPQNQAAKATSLRDKGTMLENDSSKNYIAGDIGDRVVKGVGSKPYDIKEDKDVLASDSRYLQIHEGDRHPGERDRYLSEDYSRSDGTRDSSRLSSTYDEELLRRAYERVSSQGQETPLVAPSVRSHETKAIPGFKTLQDQQAKWSDMFHKIEDEHRRELRSQYDRHQYNIQRLQQQMELELQKQHLAIRKKLDIHKEALAKMSPDRDSSARYRSPDRSLSPDRGQRSPGRSMVERSTDRSSLLDEQNELAKLHGSFDSKTWREIYREVREEEEKELSPRPLKRSLDGDFATIDSSLDRSRPSGRRSSPRGSSDLSRSGSRERSREATLDNSQRTPTNARFSKAEKDRSLGKDSSRSHNRDMSPEGRDSRSLERESWSRSFGRESVSPMPVGDGASQENVSRHVRQLLDNLNDSRHSLQDLEDDVTLERPSGHHGDIGSERPRAGVYSSPMPFLSKGRLSKSTDRSAETPATLDSSRFTQSLPVGGDRAEFYRERPRTTGGTDRVTESYRLDDSSLSPSTRMNLREKHSKHLADLRAYYEDELRELRKALSDTMDASGASVDTSMQSFAQSQLVETENKHLTDRCRTLEDEMEEMQIHVRTLEQKNLGLEKRASEYAGAFTDSQTMCIQHRAHVEELQRYCRERDDLINELESKKVSNDDSVKIYKKNLEDEMELHRQDKMSLQRMMDRYESLEREFKLLQETMNTTENKLYEARTDVVELNRTISKLELENKRLGRENDNLRHKVTQSLNLSQLHESFGSPSSPREVQNNLKPRTSSSAQHDMSLSMSQPGPTDQRLPGFATAMQDWTPAQKSRPKSAEVNRSRQEDASVSRHSVVQKDKKESKSRRKETGESSKGRQSEKSTGARVVREDTSMSSSRDDVSNRPQSRKKCPDERPVRDRTPPRREVTSPRSVSPSSQAESEMSDYSPLLKAERELFKLRDMMRQAVAVKKCPSPPQPKLQKKFYGSERPSNADDYIPDLGVARGRKEKPSISSHSSVAKTKSAQTPLKSEKSNAKRSTSGKSERSDKSDKSSKSKDRGLGSEEERRERGKEKVDRETRRPREKTPPGREEFANSSTRFDIDFDEKERSLTVTPRKSENQSGKQKNLVNGEAGDQSNEVKQAKSASKETSTGASGQIENTLEMMRSGQYTSRPEWENIYTSMAKPKTQSQDRPRNMEEKVKERMRSIAEMESRYDGLQVQKRQLESSINKIPLHGRVDRNNRKHKEELENELDAVERELGSLKMTLKRYNVLKTAG